MIQRDGLYHIPLLPKAMADRLKSLPKDRNDWPSDFRNRYEAIHSEFVLAKKEFASWVRKDRDSRMNKTAKEVFGVILDCLNCDTGRCDPSHQFIADELGLSVRTIERTIPRIADSKWLSITRRGRTTTNFYRLSVPVSKVNGILDYSLSLRERRAEERERRRQFRPESDPSEMSGHSDPDPTKVADHDPSEMAGHDPTKMAGKHMKGTGEDEHVNEVSCSEGREGTYTHARTREMPIPSNPSVFGVWVRLNIPDPRNHNEAMSLLRAGKMTLEELRRLSA